MTSQIVTMQDPQPTRVLTVARSDIRAISSVEVGGANHWLGEHRDLRRHDALARFISDQGRLYEDQTVPRVRFTEAVSASASIGDLERINESRLRRYAQHRLFHPFDNGTISREPVLRDRFLAALYVWSVFFQRMLYARQSVCTDPNLREIYAGHLREEFGHDQLLRERHGVATEVYDPILEAAGNWFLMHMYGTNEAAKIVIVHLVVESSCHIFGERTKVAFPSSPTAESSYFDIHAELDEDHSRLGRDYLRGLSPSQFPELMRVCEQAWDQLELAHDRIAAQILQ